MKPGLALLLVLALPPTLAGEAPLEHLQSLDDTRYHRLIAGEQHYHLYVRSPPAHEPGDGRLATVYLLDGGITFPLLGAYARYLELADELPPLLIVGISYGTSDWREGNSRSHDFTGPAADRPHYGGAEDFQALLRKRVFPLVEATYPSDPDRRFLFGQSLGGQFAIHSALFAPELFRGLIASNPALHRNLALYLTEKPAVPEKPPLLFVALAERDAPRFRGPALEWVDFWVGHAARPFRLEIRELAGHNHFSAAPAAFRHGLAWLLREGAPAPVP